MSSPATEASSSNWMTMLRLTGACCGGISIAIGIYQVVTSAANPRSIINGIYSVIFGLLIWIAEARWVGLLKHFKFLTHFLGLGLFYIFLGGLCLGGAWYQWAEAIFCLACGSCYLALGILCRTMAEPGFHGNGELKVGSSGYGDPTKAGQMGADGKKNPDAISDLKRKAAHHAVDYAIDHPDQVAAHAGTAANASNNNPFA